MTDLTRKRLQAAEAKVRHAKESLETVQKAVHDLHLHKQNFDQMRDKRKFCRLRRMSMEKFDDAAAANTEAETLRNKNRRDRARNELWKWQEAGRGRDEGFLGDAFGTPLAYANLKLGHLNRSRIMSNREYILGSIGYACQFGLVPAVREMMDRSQTGPNDRLWPSSPPFLHLAAGRGHAACVRFLLERGADPEATDHEGATAFYRACCAGKLDVVRILADEYDCRTTTDLSGDSAFYMAVSKGHYDVVKFLLGPTREVNFHSQRKRVIPKAIACGYTRILWLLRARVKQDDEKATVIQALGRGHLARKYCAEPVRLFFCRTHLCTGSNALHCTATARILILVS